jgi:hypothetical protein
VAGFAALRVAMPAAIVLCLADLVLVQDLGIPGGLFLTGPLPQLEQAQGS